MLKKSQINEYSDMHAYEWVILQGSRRKLAHLIGGCAYTLLAMLLKVSSLFLMGMLHGQHM
jgi:hypothetical protein